MYPYWQSVVTDAVASFDLPINNDARKSFIRTNPKIMIETRRQGMTLIEKSRDHMIDRLRNMNDDQVQNFIETYWLNCQVDANPKYIQLYMKKRGPGISDPIDNPRTKAIKERNYKFYESRCEHDLC
jgi:hypothetical protein